MQEVAELEKIQDEYERLVAELTAERSRLLQQIDDHDLVVTLDDTIPCPGYLDLHAVTAMANPQVVDCASSTSQTLSALNAVLFSPS